MVMAQGLMRHLLGRDWRCPRDNDRLRELRLYCDLLRWFADCPGQQCIYSIHNMVQIGMTYDKLPGEWYGPSTAAYVLRDLALVGALAGLLAPGSLGTD
jgi:cysteine protease ATG4